MAALTTNKSILSWIDEKQLLLSPTKSFGLTVAKSNLKSFVRKLASQVRCVN